MRWPAAPGRNELGSADLGGKTRHAGPLEKNVKTLRITDLIDSISSARKKDPGRRLFARAVWMTLLSASTCALMLTSGCARGDPDRLLAPRVSIAPYDTAGLTSAAPVGEIAWAVLPLRNETGTTDCDAEAITDALVASVSQVRGVRSVPLNRTLETMRTLKMREIRTPGEARILANALNVDGLIAGTITAYDPYDPQLGLTVLLYARQGVMTGHTAPPPGLNARQLSYTATMNSDSRTRNGPDGPVALVSEHLDGKSHETLMAVRSYADGRHDALGAITWRRYVESVPLFTEFAAHHVVAKLVESEWVRTARLGGNPPMNSPQEPKAATRSGMPGPFGTQISREEIKANKNQTGREASYLATHGDGGQAVERTESP